MPIDRVMASLVIALTDLSVDVMDVSGEHQLDLLTSVLKQRLSVDGKQISEEPQQTTNEEKDAQTTEKSTNTTCLRSDRELINHAVL